MSTFIAPLALDDLGRQILQRSTEHACDSRVLLCEGSDPRVLRAARELADRGTVRPILFGDQVVDDAARSAGISIADIDRLDPAAFAQMPDDGPWRASCRPVVQAANALNGAAVDAMVAGAIHSSADVLRVAIRDIGAATPGSPVSQAVLLDTSASKRLEQDALLLADIVVCPNPTAEQLSHIAIASVKTWNILRLGVPRVAFLSFSTLGSAETAETRKVRRAHELFSAAMPDVLADGELQLDSALDPATARLKGAMTLAGGANILIFPNLDAANIGFKMAQLAGGFNPYGVIQGVRRPCVDVSRRTSVEDLVVMAALAGLSAVRTPEFSHDVAHQRPDGGMT